MFMHENGDIVETAIILKVVNTYKNVILWLCFWMKQVFHDKCMQGDFSLLLLMT